MIDQKANLSDCSVTLSYCRSKKLDEIKNSRTSPDVQFKEFSFTKQKLDQERTMSQLGKPFPKKDLKVLKN